MKKIKLSVAALTIAMSMNAQDTLCTYFKGKDVYHFDYQQDTILSVDKQTAKFYEVNLKYGDVLCLDLSDEKLRVRKVITTFFDGSTSTQVLDSKDNVYYTQRGVVKVSVGKPKFIIKL
jgi:hypothetical protein